MTEVQIRAAERARVAILKQLRERNRDQAQNLAAAEAWRQGADWRLSSVMFFYIFAWASPTIFRLLDLTSLVFR